MVNIKMSSCLAQIVNGRADTVAGPESLAPVWLAQARRPGTLQGIFVAANIELLYMILAKKVRLAWRLAVFSREMVLQTARVKIIM